MADPDAAGQVTDPFDGILGAGAQTFGPPLEAQPSAAPDPFSHILGDAIADPATSAPGAFTRGAVRGALPAAGGLAAAGAGALAGGEAGLELGPWGVAGGAIVGGLIGGFATGKAQDYALSQAPDSWVEALGQDDRQQRLDQEQHPYASFLGGLLPFALTMKPGGLAQAALPENATTLQRIMTNPVTARVFGGAMVGGIELGQEAAEGDVDWRKVAISSAFGLVFNRPNRIGETIEGMVPRALGVRSPLGAEIGARAAERPPTLAEAADAKVAGPGVVRDVWDGSQRQDPTAEAVAQDAARTEQSIIAPPPVDLDARAREMHPELFTRYDDLQSQRDTYERWIAEEPENELPKQHLASIDRDIEEIGPDISAALRRAGDRTQEPTVPAQTLPVAPYDAVQWDFIAGDAARQFEAAGEPAQRASDLGQIVAANMATLARDFEGKIGTAEEIYRREGAEIRAGGEQAPARTLIDPALARETAERMANTVNPEIPATVPAPPQRTPIDAALAAETAARMANAVNLEIPATVAAPPQRTPIDAALAAETAARMANAPPIESPLAGRVLRAKPPGEKATSVKPPIDVEAARAKADRLGVTNLIQALADRATPDEIADMIGEKMTGPEIAALLPKKAPIVVPEVVTPEAARAKAEQFGIAKLIDGFARNGATPSEVADYLKENLADKQMTAAEIEAMRQTPVHTIEFQGKTYTGATHLEAVTNARRATGIDINRIWEAVTPETTAEEVDALNRRTPLQQNRADRTLGEYTPVDVRGGPRGLLTLFSNANATTAVHELGHDFLERLARYAAHPDAPLRLRADWQVAKEFARVRDDAPLSSQRRAHEKMANAFMRYLSEGRAPSRGLAGVFERFKDWMASLYNTVKGLRAPISDDIRGVFDRWLAAERPETVIASEPPRQTSPTELHIADEANATPAQALPAAERIAAEREEPPPRGIADEIAPVEMEAAGGAAHPAGEVGRGDAGLAEVERGRGEAGAESGGGGVGGERGAERPGGGEPAAEGVRAAAGVGGRSEFWRPS